MWDTLLDQLRAACRLDSETGCLLWPNAVDKNGYSRTASAASSTNQERPMPASLSCFNTGMHHKVDKNEPLPGFPEYDPTSRKHYWIVMVSYHIADPQPGVPRFLDQENLRDIAGPVCYFCEQDWDPDLAKEPCVGHPHKVTFNLDEIDRLRNRPERFN